MAISSTMKTHLAKTATYLAHAWRVEERPRELVIHWAAASVANVTARGGYLKKTGGTDGSDDAAGRSIASFDGDIGLRGAACPSPSAESPAVTISVSAGREKRRPEPLRQIPRSASRESPVTTKVNIA